MTNVRFWACVLLGLGALVGDARAQTRLFMAMQGTQSNAPTTGPVTLPLMAGDVVTIGVWLEDLGQVSDLNSLQVIIPWQGSVQSGSLGTASYIDSGNLGQGLSVFVDESDHDYVFAGGSTDPVTYHETPPPPPGVAGFGFITGYPTLTEGNAVVGIRYLGEFDLQVSTEACGMFVMSFVPQLGSPAGGTSFFAPNSNPYIIDEFQDLVVTIGGTTAADVDDCNQNGVIDGCDLTEGTSVDDDTNGIPDECVAALAGGNWSDDIWGLSGPTPYPDDLNGIPGMHVTLSGGTVEVDVNVRIESLRLMNGATLRVVQENDPTDAPVGDLTINQRLTLANAVMAVARDRLIACLGPVDIFAGGRYERAKDIEVPCSARMEVARLTVYEGITPGRILLDDAMVLSSSGTLLLDGTGIPPDGDCSPPDLCAEDEAVVEAQTFRIDEAARIDYTSSNSAVISRGLDNRSTFVDGFTWHNAGMQFFGSPAPSPLPQTFEVAGVDIGPDPAGFWANFALRDVEVTDGSHVTFSDGIDNAVNGVLPFTEALYVHTLTLRDGSFVTLHDCNVYYYELIVEPEATIDPQSNGQLIPICDVTPCCDTNMNQIRDDPCAWCDCTGEACVSTPIVYGDVGGDFGECYPDGFVNIHDSNQVVNCFAGTSSCIDYNVNVGGPFGSCVMDMFCNVHDKNLILAVFGGTSTCSCGGGPAPQPPGGFEFMDRGSVGVIADRSRITSGERVQVDVVLEKMPQLLQSIQLHVSVSGGYRGRLNLVDVFVRSNGHHVFEGASSTCATNLERGQMFCGLDDLDGVQPFGPYVATFIFEASTDAAGTFVIDLLHDHEAGDQTFVVGPYHSPVQITTVDPALVTVQSRSGRMRGQ
jgi:hypothetical protein